MSDKMLIRKYRAKNLKEALKLVKAELGENATILSSRTISSGLWGSKIELTATIPPMENLTPPVRTARPAPQPVAPPKPSSPTSEMQQIARFLSPFRQELRALNKELKILANGSKKADRIEKTLAELHKAVSKIQQQIDQNRKEKTEPISSPQIVALNPPTVNSTGEKSVIFPAAQKMSSRLSAKKEEHPRSVAPSAMEENLSLVLGKTVAQLAQARKAKQQASRSTMADSAIAMAGGTETVTTTKVHPPAVYSLQGTTLSTLLTGNANSSAMSNPQAEGGTVIQDNLTQGVLTEEANYNLSQDGVIPQKDITSEQIEPNSQQIEIEREIMSVLCEKLLGSGMRRSLVKKVMAQVAALLPSNHLEAKFCADSLAAQVMGEEIQCIEALEQRDSSQVVALVGPSGVGKTTTLAKIATRAALIHGKRVAIIGCDTERIGAVPALQEMAHLIGAPFRLAKDSAGLCQAVKKLSKHDLILVDTSGFSVRDTENIDQLNEMLENANVDSYLVINADMRGLEMDANLKGYAKLNPRALIFTKVDQAFGLGSLYDATVSSRLPVMYLTNGRQIPDDIEESTPERVVSLIMGFQYN